MNESFPNSQAPSWEEEKKPLCGCGNLRAEGPTVWPAWKTHVPTHMEAPTRPEGRSEADLKVKPILLPALCRAPPGRPTGFSSPVSSPAWQGGGLVLPVSTERPVLGWQLPTLHNG